MSKLMVIKGSKMVQDMSENSEERQKWGSYAIYLFDEFGGRPRGEELIQALSMNAHEFGAGTTGLAYESMLLRGDILEDYFISPNTTVPAPWLLNSPELLVLWNRKELGLEVLFADQFFRAVVRGDFSSANFFSEFVEACYPEFIASVPKNYDEYKAKVPDRKINSGAWDKILEDDPSFFYEKIRPSLKAYAAYFDSHVCKVDERLVQKGAAKKADEAVPQLIDSLLRELYTRPGKNQQPDAASYFPNLYEGTVLVNPVKELLERFLRAPKNFSMSTLQELAKQELARKNLRNEEQVREIMWAARRVYIANLEARHRPIPHLGRFESSSNKLRWVDWIASGLRYEMHNQDAFQQELEHLHSRRVRITEEIIRNVEAQTIQGLRKQNWSLLEDAWSKRYAENPKFLSCFYEYLGSATSELREKGLINLKPVPGYYDKPAWICQPIKFLSGEGFVNFILWGIRTLSPLRSQTIPPIGWIFYGTLEALHGLRRSEPYRKWFRRHCGRRLLRQLSKKAT